MAVTNALADVGAILSVYDNPADLLFERDNVPKLAAFWAKLDKQQKLSYNSTDETEQLIVRKFRSDIEGDKNWRHNKSEFREDKPVNKIPKLNGTVLIEYCGNHRLSAMAQVNLLFRRNIRQASRDKVFFYGRYAAFLFAALVVGLFFQGIGLASEKAYFNTTMLYFCSNALLAAPALMAVMQAQRNFSSYLRENINGWYSPSTYYLARSILEWILQSSATSMFVVIAWFLTKQYDPSYSFIWAELILVIQAVCCYHLMFMPSLFLDGQTNFQLPFLLSTIQTLLGGYMIPPNDLPHIFFYLSKLNFGLYSYLGLMKIVYSPHDGKEFELTCETGNPILCVRFPNGTSVLNANSIEPGGCSIEIAALLVFTVAYIVLGLPAMISRTKGAKNEIARVTSKDKKVNVQLKSKVNKV